MIEIFTFTEQGAAFTSLAVVGLMFVMFLRETYPTEVVAMTGVGLLFVLGLLPYEGALAVLSNSAPWTIAAMFVVMGALVRTGALEALTAFATRHAKTRPRMVLVVMMGFVLLASAIMSNTPVVVVMIPIFVQLARSMDKSASKLLIPLSYAAIMGGMLTLVGTSTNLLVDGVAQAQGLKNFTIFEVTPLAAILASFGMLYLWLVAPRLLPERDSMANLLSDRSKMRFFTEAVIPPDSNLVGREVLSVQLFKREGVRLIDVIRAETSLRRDLASVTLQVGDRVVLRSQITELLSLQRNKSLKRMDQVSAVETETVEVLITPGCKMIGRTLRALRLRRRYGIYVLAVHRRNQNIGRQIDDLVVRVGDTLLIEGPPADIQRLAQDMDLVDVSQPSAQPFRRSHAPIAIATLIGMVALAALGVAPLLVLALLAIVIVLTTGCVDAEEAFSFVDGRLLALIFSMLAVGVALQHTGAVAMIARGLAPLLADLPPALIVWAIYLLTSVLTELVSNNAVAVVLTPVAIGLGQSLGIDPRALVVAVMIAASASFATPIGYQTNTLVYGPGGYRFADFLRVGVPLNLSLGVLSALLIPIFFPL